jgi:DNA repair exonuclease SbcCD nuclease subunit
MKLLLVGDVHAQANDLSDCAKLQDLVIQVTQRVAPDAVVYLGDLHHNFVLVNVEVQRFWIQELERLRRETAVGEIVILAGNHDKPADATSLACALQVYCESATVVDKPHVDGDILYAPYMADQEKLLEACSEYPECGILIAHQTFNGSQFENGFFAKGAIDPERFPQKNIISGHIHAPARFGKVWYPGSPRWLIRSDANTERFISVVSTSGDGYEVLESIPTDQHVRVRRHYSEQEGGTAPDIIGKDGDLEEISLEGNHEWCRERRQELAAIHPGLRFDLKMTLDRVHKVKESDGLGKAFERHLNSYPAKYGTDRSVLYNRCSGLNIWSEK